MRKAVYVTMLVLAFLMMTLNGCGRQNDTAGDDTTGVEITGTWQTASMVPSDDGTVTPEYYVQFTDSNINYGHMKDGEFVLVYSDQITLLDETASGGFIVQAESSNGIQYTYQTCESDKDVLEYYETWHEEDFPQMYRGGASLSKSN